MLNAIKKAMIALVLCGQFMQGANEWLGNPLRCDCLKIVDSFDFTKKGNVYEKTFRVPYQLLGQSPLKFSVCFSDKIIDPSQALSLDEMADPNIPIQNEHDFITRFYNLWHFRHETSICSNQCPDIDDHKCFRQCLDTKIRNIYKHLQNHHPNQHFKFKLTFHPMKQSKEKIMLSYPMRQDIEKLEGIVQFPLYYISKNANDQPRAGRHCVLLFEGWGEVWRKYYFRFEVLEDTILPKELTPFILITTDGPNLGGVILEEGVIIQ